MQGGEHLKAYIPEESIENTSLEEILAEFSVPLSEKPVDSQLPDTAHAPHAPPPQIVSEAPVERKVWVWKRNERAEVKDVEPARAPDKAAGPAQTNGKTTPDMMADTMDLSSVLGSAKKHEKNESAAPESARLSPAAAVRKCERRIASIHVRVWPLAILAAAMVILTLSSKLTNALGGLSANLLLCSVILLACQLACCVLGLDVLIQGIKDILILQPRTESVIFLAVLFSALHALVGILSPESMMGLPFCAVGVCALMFYQLGHLKKLRAERMVYKLYLSSPEPFAVCRRSGDWDGGDILIKQSADPYDFVDSCQEEDGAQRLYKIVCPAILILIIVSSLIILLHGGGLSGFLRALASLSSACAAFASSLCFAIPLRRLNKVLLHYGAAISSWKGAKEISRGGGVIITDSDLFPPGKAVLSGMKIIGPSSVEWVLSVCASVMEAAGSELARPFMELMLEQGGSRRRVDNLFYDNSGGYIADSQGCHIYIGTRAFMHKQGVQLYDAIQVGRGLYLAINKILTAVFIVNYTASAGVTAGLRSLTHRTSYKLIFALRDFLIDSDLIEEEFACRTDRILFPDLTESGRFLALGKSAGGVHMPAGIICRDGLAPYAFLLLGSRKLARRTMLSCVITLIAAVLGMEFMFFLGLSGNFSAASAANLLIYNLLWLLPTCWLGMGASRL